MGLGNLNLIENLVYGIFGNPIIWSITLLMMFTWYATKYDIPKWSYIIFLVPLSLWLSLQYLPGWIVIIISIAIGTLVGPKLFRATRS